MTVGRHVGKPSEDSEWTPQSPAVGTVALASGGPEERSPAGTRLSQAPSLPPYTLGVPWGWEPCPGHPRAGVPPVQEGSQVPKRMKTVGDGGLSAAWVCAT